LHSADDGGEPTGSEAAISTIMEMSTRQMLTPKIKQNAIFPIQFILCVCINASAQLIDTLWANRIASSGDQIPYGIGVTSQNNNAIVLQTGLNTAGYELLSINLQNGKDLSSPVELDASRYQGIKKMIVTKSGNLAFCGVQSEKVYFETGLLDGTTLIQSVIDSSTTKQPRDLIQTSDEGYLIVGQAERDSGTNCWLHKIDGNGVTQWETIVPDSLFQSVLSVEELPDRSGYVVAGGIRGSKYPGYGPGIMWCFDDNGKYLYSRVFPHAGTISAVTCFTDGTFVVGGVIGSGSDWKSWYIARLNQQGDLLWEIKDTVPHGSQTLIRDAITLPCGDAVFVGSDNYRIHVRQISPEGTVKGTFYELQYGNCEAMLAVNSLNNDFIVCGYKSTMSDTDDADVWIGRFGLNNPPYFISSPDDLFREIKEDTVYGAMMTSRDSFSNDTPTFYPITVPTGMSVSSKGNVQWQPATSADSGLHTILIGTKDRLGQRDSLAYQLRVIPVNDSPVIDSITGLSLYYNTGDSLVLKIYASDEETNPLNYTWTLSSGQTYEGAGFVYSLENTAIGHESLSIEASDGELAVHRILNYEIIDTGAIPIVIKNTETQWTQYTEIMWGWQNNKGDPNLSAVKYYYRIWIIVDDTIRPDTCMLDSVRYSYLIPAYCGCKNILKSGTMTLILQTYDIAGYQTRKWQLKSCPYKNTDVVGNYNHNHLFPLHQRRLLLKSENSSLESILLPSNFTGRFSVGIFDLQGRTIFNGTVDVDKQPYLDIPRGIIGAGTFVLLMHGPGAGNIIRRFVVGR
jgi:hypothetical protein